MRQIYAKSSDNVQSKADSAQQKKQSLYKTQITTAQGSGSRQT